MLILPSHKFRFQTRTFFFSCSQNRTFHMKILSAAHAVFHELCLFPALSAGFRLITVLLCVTWWSSAHSSFSETTLRCTALWVRSDSDVEYDSLLAELRAPSLVSAVSHQELTRLIKGCRFLCR